MSLRDELWDRLLRARFAGACARSFDLKRSAASRGPDLCRPGRRERPSAALGQPSPWQFGLQQSATPVMDSIIWFHDFLLYIITAIAAFVLVLLLIVIVRFNARRNPIPARTTHNTFLEIAWTTIPIVILLVIAVPSFKLLFFQLIPPPADLTVKATGKQWYWSYTYPDNGKFEFDSLMLKANELKPDQPRLLAVDNEMVVPVNKNVHVSPPGPTSSIPSRCPRSASRSMPSPAGSTRPGSRPPAKASITASARSFAARITPSCRSRCVW